MGVFAALVLSAQLVVAPVVVVDGDTFDAGGVRYRIANLDAPSESGRCPAERALARLASAHLAAALAGAQRVEVVETARQPATARYRERVVAQVSVDGVDLAAAMIAAGLARPASAQGAWCETISRGSAVF